MSFFWHSEVFKETLGERPPGKSHSEGLTLGYAGVCLLTHGFWQFVGRYDPCVTDMQREEL